jgi:hypothetical protein
MPHRIWILSAACRIRDASPATTQVPSGDLRTTIPRNASNLRGYRKRILKRGGAESAEVRRESRTPALRFSAISASLRSTTDAPLVAAPLRCASCAFPRLILQGALRRARGWKGAGALVLATLLHPAPALACAACYGQSDSPMAQGMNWGILSLLGTILTVLGGIATFFICLARRQAAIASSALPRAVPPLHPMDTGPGGTAPEFGTQSTLTALPLPLPVWRRGLGRGGIFPPDQPRFIGREPSALSHPYSGPVGPAGGEVRV